MNHILQVETMVFDTDISRIHPLADLLIKVCGEGDVLPRTSAKEVEYALGFISPQVFVARNSQLTQHPSVASMVCDLYANGIDIILVQDQAVAWSDEAMSFGNLYVVPAHMADIEIPRLLVLLKVLRVASLNRDRSSLY